MTNGDPHTLEWWKEQLQGWETGGGFAEDKQFSMLRGKMESVLLYGTPHSAGIMYKYHNTAGRLTTILQHYQHLKEVRLVDVIGSASFAQEADAFGIRLASLTGKEGDRDKIVIFLKFAGHHAFAEDGGTMQSKPKGGGKGKTKAAQPWNKWARQDTE